jgi:hypothetical protein
MKAELEAQLLTKYPELFKDNDKPETESLMCFGCECGDGWFKIIDSACRLLAAHIKSKPELHDFRWVQIKEKFATLRLYYTGLSDEYVSGVIDMAEAMSGVTCEVCGNSGKQRGGGWIRTLCDACDTR